MKMKTVMQVYKHMLERATYLRTGKAFHDADETMTLKEVGNEMAAELMFFCGELEDTEEINPTQ